MPKTPFFEKPGPSQALGAAFVALILFFVWVSYAFFAHVFEERETVTLKTSTVGLQLPKRADVKLRGMIVGEVQKIEAKGDGATLTLGIIPEMMDEIPAGVSAQIIPKTLFGQKFVDLLPPEEKVPGNLQPGDVIERASVPVEVEQLLNSAYPLLTSVQPAELSYTLSALSTALGGRGEKLGDTLVSLNAYFTEINPDIPALVNDLVQLGNVSDIYADALPDLARLLNNVSTTSKTIVSQRQQLVAFFSNTTALANTLDAFVERSGDDIVSVTRNGAPILRLLAKYVPSFPCVQAGLSATEPRISNAFRTGKLHVDGQFFGPDVSPTGYTADENIAGSQAVLNDHPLARANCLELEEIVAAIDENPDAAGPYPNETPYSFQDDAIYSLINLKTRHNKYCVFPVGAPSGGDCNDEPLPRTAAEQLYSGAGISGDDSAAERAALNAMIGGFLGLDSDEVPDVASLLVSPILRGSAVSF